MRRRLSRSGSRFKSRLRKLSRNGRLSGLRRLTWLNRNGSRFKSRLMWLNRNRRSRLSELMWLNRNGSRFKSRLSRLTWLNWL